MKKLLRTTIQCFTHFMTARPRKSADQDQNQKNFSAQLKKYRFPGCIKPSSYIPNLDSKTNFTAVVVERI